MNGSKEKKRKKDLSTNEKSLLASKFPFFIKDKLKSIFCSMFSSEFDPFHRFFDPFASWLIKMILISTSLKYIMEKKLKTQKDTNFKGKKKYFL